jgi:dihydroflavonol-4-reductase
MRRRAGPDAFSSDIPMWQRHADGMYAKYNRRRSVMDVFITGGTGFIGSRLALRCLQRGDSVSVLGQENNPAERENRTLIESKGAKVWLGPVTDKRKIFELVNGVDVIYHLAAAQHEANVPDQHFREVNVNGTRNVIEAAIQSGVKRFVHGSTIGVYGSALSGELNEASVLRPDNIYGVTKLEGEKLVLSYRDKLAVVIIRISETYGPGDRRLLKLFRAIKKNAFFMIGNGKNLHHLVYVDDLIDGLLLAAVSEAAVGKIFVLAGAEAVTSDEMIGTIARQLGTRIPGIHLPLFPFLLAARVMETLLRPVGIQSPLHTRRMDFFRKSLVFSQEAARTHLNYIPMHTFSQGVEKSAEWYAGQGYI